jgi:hypothetical protein
MADISDLLDYYVNLLIIQYNNQPKARATIELLVNEFLASGVLLEIRDGYDIETAAGVQLDVLGKYVGVNRFFEVFDPIDYFALTYYDEVAPDSLDKWGFTDYAHFDDFQYNGTLNYYSVLSITSRLNDDDYRVVIKLKILQNNSNHSHKAIDDGIYNFFGMDVRPSSIGDMQMTYFITINITAIIRAALTKSILPRPMGVGLNLIENVDGDFYSYATYDNLTPANVTGFTTYSLYATKTGNVLIYDQITVV